MDIENRKKIAKILAVIVGVSGILVMAGWLGNIGFLKSISPAWISMKFTTALTFFLSGLALYFIVRAAQGKFDSAQVVLSIVALLIVLLMGTLLFSSFLGVHTGEEDLFAQDAGSLVKTVVPGRPSLPTMIAFILMAVACIFTILAAPNLKTKLRNIGMAIGVIGGVAIAGYVANIPLLYYYIKDINSAMAVHTAALFILLGIGLLCLSE